MCIWTANSKLQTPVENTSPLAPSRALSRCRYSSRGDCAGVLLSNLHYILQVGLSRVVKKALSSESPRPTAPWTPIFGEGPSGKGHSGKGPGVGSGHSSETAECAERAGIQGRNADSTRGARSCTAERGVPEYLGLNGKARHHKDPDRDYLERSTAQLLAFLVHVDILIGELR